MKSKLIGIRAAVKLQNKAQRCGDLIIWTMYDHPTDLPNFFVARPFIGERALPVHMTAVTLAALRFKLPLGLTRLNRYHGDDPVILETWL